MKQLTISMPPALLERMKGLAAERGTSMAAVFREAIIEKIAAIEGDGRPTPAP
jgi:predicted DNA-binding protein